MKSGDLMRPHVQPPALLKDEAREPMTKKGPLPWPSSFNIIDQVLMGEIVGPLILTSLESTHISVDSMALIIDLNPGCMRTTILLPDI